MNSNSRLKLAGRWIAGVCVVASAVALPWQWARHSEIRRITATWYEGRVDEFMSSWQGLDRTMRDASGGGNVLLRFVGFDPDIPGHVEIVQQASWRGAYALYPRRVLVADEGTRISSARDILTSGFNPTMQWMQEHDVRAVLHLQAVGRDGFALRREVIPPGGGR